MRLKSKGLGRKELVMDFREYRVVPDGNEVRIEGTITDPVHWDFTIRMCQDDLPGLTKVLFKKEMLFFLLKAAVTRKKASHWSSDDAKPTPAKASPAKTSTPAAKSGAGASDASTGDKPSGDRAAKLAEIKARASQSKGDSGAASGSPFGAKTASAASSATTPAASTPTPAAKPAPAAAAKPAAAPAAKPAAAAAAPAEKPKPRPKHEDDYSRGLLNPTGTKPAGTSEFSTGKSVSFGAPKTAPAAAKPAAKAEPKAPKADTKPAPVKPAETKAKTDDKKTASDSTKKPDSKAADTKAADDKTKKTSTGTKPAANGGTKPLAPAEGTKS